MHLVFPFLKEPLRWINPKNTYSSVSYSSQCASKQRILSLCNLAIDVDVIIGKHFPRYWPFVGGIHWSPVNSPHKGQWRRALMFSLICAWINGWVNNREADDLRHHRAHYGVIVMETPDFPRSCLKAPAWNIDTETPPITYFCINQYKKIFIFIGYRQKLDIRNSRLCYDNFYNEW